MWKSAGTLEKAVSTGHVHPGMWCNILHVVSCFAQYYPAAVKAIYKTPLSVYGWRSSCMFEDSFDQLVAFPKHAKHFQWGLDLENTFAIQGIQYPRCLYNPEQQVFDDMLSCRPWKQMHHLRNTEKANMKKNFLNESLAHHSPSRNHLLARKAIDLDAGPFHDTLRHISVPFLDIFYTISSTTLTRDQLVSTIRR